MASKKESGVVGWFLEKAVEAPLIRGACVHSVEVSAVLVKEVPEPPRAFSHQANHVFTLPQRSELILTSNCRMGKLKTSNVDRQDLDFLGAQSQIGLQCKWARSLTGQ